MPQATRWKMGQLNSESGSHHVKIFYDPQTLQYSCRLYKRNEGSERISAWLPCESRPAYSVNDALETAEAMLRNTQENS